MNDVVRDGTVADAGLVADVGVSLGTFELAIEIDVAPGERLAVLGPNGAGKTTLLRVLAGLQPLDRGRVTLDGEVLDDPAGARVVRPERRSIGVVFQDYLLFRHLDATDNVAFGLRATGVARGEARRRATELLRRMGLDEHLRHRPAELSGGQQQRVALARALARRPRLLLLDEPLAALDVGTRAEIRRELRRQLESYEGFQVLVTHDPLDAYALADRVAILEAGRVVQVGSLAEVTAHPRSRYVADLVGTNLIAGTVAGGALVTSSGATVVVVDAVDGPAHAAIRPQSIVLTREAVAGTSARNSWPGVVREIDRLGDRVRVLVGGAMPLVAEITVAALHALEIHPGDEVQLSVKATDISVYPV